MRTRRVKKRFLNKTGEANLAGFVFTNRAGADIEPKDKFVEKRILARKPN